MRSVRTALLLIACAAAGCSSQWYPGNAKRDIVRTDLLIETTPPGATVVFDGKTLPETSPLILPIEYDHVETEYERQTNAGQSMRESMGPVLTVLTFPVWMVASLFHSRQTRRRHEYGGASHVVSAYIPGRDDAQEAITLEGEAKRTVKLTLPASK